MNRSTALLLALLVLAPAAIAQEKPPEPAGPVTQDKTPRHDPEAVAQFKAMLAKVYKPRKRGLKKLNFKLTIQQKQGEITRDVGSFLVEWTPNSLAVKLPDGKPAPAQIAKSPFMFQAVRDAVGFEPFEQLKVNHFEKGPKGTVKLVVPEWVEKSPVGDILFIPDAAGRVGIQRAVSRSGKLFFERSFEYVAHGEFWVVSTARQSGQDRNIRNYARSMKSGFLLPDKVMILRAQAQTLITYSDYQVNPEDKPAEKAGK